MSSNDNGEEQSAPVWAKWKSRLVAALVIAAGLAHAILPKWLALDWPTIVLVFCGVLLLFLPISDIGAVVESLEIGKTKILFRQVKQLDESVQRAELEAVAEAPKLAAIGGTKESVPTKRSLGAFDNWIDTLLMGDKDTALIKISIEIERYLRDLQSRRGLNLPINTPIVKTIRLLEKEAILSPQAANALYEFQKVRNAIVHPVKGEVSAGVKLSALDSGVTLLQILKASTELDRDVSSSGDDAP